MVPGGGGVSGEKEEVGERIVLVENKCLIVDRSRDEDEAIEIDPKFVLQEVAKPCSAEGAIAFACNVFGGIPPFIFGQIVSDEFTDRFDVPFDAIRFLVGGAEAGSGRVDKDEVGQIENRFHIVDNFVWGGDRLPFFRGN